MKLTLDVVFADGNTAQVSTNLWCITQWERKYKSKVSQMATGIGAEDLAYLAYEACKISDVVVPLDFDSFIKKLDRVDVVEKPNPNPTQGEHNAAD